MDSKQNGGRRLDAYIRVSRVGGREGDSFTSPKIQEERIHAWAVANGHQVIEVHRELDVSGGTMDRPMLNLVMARIDAGDTDGVVVYNLSRFARTLIGSVELIERINQRGALFASVSDGFDITTITGRLVMNILLAIAQSERERMQESWRTAKSDALGRKIHLSSTAPFGYVRGEGPLNTKTGKPAPAPLQIDPVTGPLVAELFRRKAAGETWRDLRLWLEAAGAPTVLGAPWSSSTVARIVRNTVYLGTAKGSPDDFPDGMPDAHPALVDEATWQAAQARRLLRADSKPAPTLLRGLVRCGGCRYTMLAHHTKPGTTHEGFNYECYRGNKSNCPSPGFITATRDNGAAGVDDVVVELMWEYLGRVEFEGHDATVDLGALEQVRDRLVARREQDAEDDEMEQALGRAGWLKHLASLTVRVDQAQAEIDETLRQLGTARLPVAVLREKWESGEMSLDEKRTQIASTVQAVFVRSGGRGGRRGGELRRHDLRKRIDIVWANDPELVDVPRQGKRGYRVGPWPFPDTDPDIPGVVPLQPEMEGAGGPVG